MQSRRASSIASLAVSTPGLIDWSAGGLDRGLARVRDHYAGSVSRGRLDPATMDRRLALIRGSIDLADAGGADLVIEAVFEDMALKQDIFRKLDATARPGALLATDTSGLDIDEIAVVTRRPEDVGGAHSSARRT